VLKNKQITNGLLKNKIALVLIFQFIKKFILSNLVAKNV